MKSDEQARKDALKKWTKADLVEEVLKLRGETQALVKELTAERARAHREEGLAVAAEQAEQRERGFAQSLRKERDDLTRSLSEMKQREREKAEGVEGVLNEVASLRTRLRLYETAEAARLKTLRNALRELLSLAPIDGSDLT